MRNLSSVWVKLFSFSFFSLAVTVLPLLPKANPIFCEIKSHILFFFFQRCHASVLKRSSPPLCFYSLFLSHVLWLQCSLAPSPVFPDCLLLTLLCSSQVHWILDLLTAVCKSSQEGGTFPLFFSRLWSLITWGKWSPRVWGKCSSCVWAGMEFIWFSLGCKTSLNVANLTSDSPVQGIAQF